MYTWNDGMRSRRRRPHLILVAPAGDRMISFAGKSIPGVCAVVGADYEKCGKWSNNTYRIELAPGWRHFSIVEGWETGTFREAIGADRWVDGANYFGVALPVFQEFLRREYPEAAEHYDSVEEALAGIPEECDGTQVAITFGGPTNRQREAGFWTWPIQVMAQGRIIAWLVPENDSRAFRVEQVDMAMPVRVVDVVRQPGHHGGYATVKVVAPDGVKLLHSPPEEE